MSPSANAVRVLVVADDLLARAGLAALLADQPGLLVVEQLAPQADLATEVAATQADVVLWDLGWRADAALRRLAEVLGTAEPGEAPVGSTGSPTEAELVEAPVVALVPDDEQSAAAALRAGCRGLLLRSADLETLTAALVAAACGLLVVDPALAALLAPQPLAAALPISPPTGTAVLPEALTARELEVLALLAEGLPNKAIARRLGISEHTVKFHVNAIMGKLSAQSRTDAVVRATRLGLIAL
ncbi:MAG: response regulator transcription factor [Caldilineales bacterium]|nr:response regulator transcription factor [Caldilineales bacterium]